MHAVQMKVWVWFPGVPLHQQKCVSSWMPVKLLDSTHLDETFEAALETAAVSSHLIGLMPDKCNGPRTALLTNRAIQCREQFTSARTGKRYCQTLGHAACKTSHI